MEYRYILNRSDKSKIDTLNSLSKDAFVQDVFRIVFNASNYNELSNWSRLIAIRQSELWPESKPNDAPTTEQWAKLLYTYRDLVKPFKMPTYAIGPITQTKISSLF